MANMLLSVYHPSMQAWKQVPITRQELRIGSAAGNDVVLPDEAVSPQHARLFSDPRGVWILDQNSSTGIYLNGQRLPANQWVLLPPGVNFTIGSATLNITPAARAAAPQRAAARKKGGLPLLPFVIGGGALLACCAVVAAAVLLGGFLPGDGGAEPTAALSGQGTPAPQSASAGYAARKPAPGETTPESTRGITSDSETTLKLSDGTQLDLPGGSPGVEVTLSRQGNTLQVVNPAFQTSGSLRALEFDRSKIGRGFIPVLTIPAAELGELDPATVNVMRVGDVQVNGETVPGQVAHLPVSIDGSGNLVVVDTATATLSEVGAVGTRPASSRLASQASPPRQGRMVRIQYMVMTFQAHLEWQIAPLLVRMIPDASLPEFRRPADPQRDQDILSRPVVNVVVLVHGHNEEEKGGAVLPSAPAPWLVTYKRDVWNELYRSYLETRQDRLDCTAFYEFIYPTFRSAYSPIAGNPAEPLGDSLQALMQAGAENDNRQLANMSHANMPVNLFLAAHSMGGLVARAGIARFDGWLQNNFQQLVTWGTPHHGSPLVTLGYILRGPYVTTHGDPVTFVLNRLIGTEVLRWAQDAWMQLDTPGTRDLRWDNIQEVNFPDQFQLIRGSVPRGQNPDDYNLVNGAWLYNNNLTEFNRGDPNRGGEKYYFLYGVTQKQLADPYIYSATAQGATLIRFFMRNPTASVPGLAGVTSQSDGAVPLASMGGLNLVVGRSDNLGDVDHEEYYSPASDVLYGGMVARRTFERLGLTLPRCNCAALSVTSSPPGGRVQVDAAFSLDPSFDRAPGKRIRTAEAFYYLDANKNEYILGDLSVASDGKLSGSFPQPDVGSGLTPKLGVRITLLDGTRMEAVEKNLGCSGVSELQVTVPSFSTFDCKQEEEWQVITLKIEVKKDGTVQRYGETIYSHPQEVSGNVDASGNLTFTFKWVGYLESDAGSEVTGTFNGSFVEGKCSIQGSASGELHVWDQGPSYCKAYDQKFPFSKEMNSK